MRIETRFEFFRSGLYASNDCDESIITVEAVGLDPWHKLE